MQYIILILLYHILSNFQNSAKEKAAKNAAKNKSSNVYEAVLFTFLVRMIMSLGMPKVSAILNNAFLRFELQVLI